LGSCDTVTSRSVSRRRGKEEIQMTLLWIIIVVAVLLAVFGYFGRGRFSR